MWYYMAQPCIITIPKPNDLNEKNIGEIKYNYWLFVGHFESKRCQGHYYYNISVLTHCTNTYYE